MSQVPFHINRENYAVLLAEFQEGRMNKEQEECFLRFMHENPDLQLEFDELMLPEPEVNELKNPDFEFLKKGTLTEADHKEWDEWILDDIEGQLSLNQKTFFKEVLASNENLRKEHTLYQLTKLQPENDLVFTSKKDLYRNKSEGGLVIAIGQRNLWYRAAAILILLLSTAYFVFNSTHQEIPENELVHLPKNQPGVEENIHSIASKSETPVSGPVKSMRRISPLRKKKGSFDKIFSRPAEGIITEASNLSTLASVPTQIISAPEEGEPVIADKERSALRSATAKSYSSLYSAAEDWVFSADTSALVRINAPKVKPGKGIALASKGLALFNRLTGKKMKLEQTFSRNGQVKKVGIQGSGFAFHWKP
jgi:hypothetical protein